MAILLQPRDGCRKYIYVLRERERFMRGKGIFTFGNKTLLVRRLDVRDKTTTTTTNMNVFPMYRYIVYIVILKIF